MKSITAMQHCEKTYFTTLCIIKDTITIFFVPYPYYSPVKAAEYARLMPYFSSGKIKNGSFQLPQSIAANT